MDTNELVCCEHGIPCQVAGLSTNKQAPVCKTPPEDSITSLTRESSHCSLPQLQQIHINSTPTVYDERPQGGSDHSTAVTALSQANTASSYSSCNTAACLDNDEKVLGLFLRHHYIGCMTQEEAINKVRANEQAPWVSIYHQLPKEVEEMRRETAHNDYSSLMTDELELHAVFRSSVGEILFNRIRSINVYDSGAVISIEFAQAPTMTEEDR